MLLFSEHDLNSVRTRTDYHALGEGTRSPSNYTIDAVARARGLKLQSNYTVSSWFASRQSLAEFIENRVEQKEPNDPEGFRRELQSILSGNYIIGSKTVNHFMNLKVDAEQGTCEAHDVQVSTEPCTESLRSRMGTIDLALKID